MSEQPPSVIYLQSEEGTWCTDRQNESDVKYVLDTYRGSIASDKIVQELLKAADSDEREDGFAYILLRAGARRIASLESALREAHEQSDKMLDTQATLFGDKLDIAEQHITALESALKERDAKIAELQQAETLFYEAQAEFELWPDGQTPEGFCEFLACRLADLLKSTEDVRKWEDSGIFARWQRVALEPIRSLFDRMAELEAALVAEREISARARAESKARDLGLPSS